MNKYEADHMKKKFKVQTSGLVGWMEAHVGSGDVDKWFEKKLQSSPLKIDDQKSPSPLKKRFRPSGKLNLSKVQSFRFRGDETAPTPMP